MWKWLRKKGVEDEQEISFWKNDFSDCLAADYLPGYSVCQCENNNTCRFVTRYAGMTLCSNPKHKSFIPLDAKPFNPTQR